MNDLEKQAQILAAQPYHAVVKREILSGGQESYFASYVELPGCMAQADSYDAVLVELREVLFEYILLSLEDGVELPKPFADLS